VITTFIEQNGKDSGWGHVGETLAVEQTFRTADPTLKTPTRSCASRLKVMHSHGIANFEGGKVLANLQRAAIGLTCLGDEIV